MLGAELMMSTRVAHYLVHVELIARFLRLTSEGAETFPTSFHLVAERMLRRDPQTGLYTVTCMDAKYTSGCTFYNVPQQPALTGDLFHLDTLMFFMALGGALCPPKQACVGARQFASTLRSAWAERSTGRDVGIGFPKFDFFLNGYCGWAAQDESRPLYAFCTAHWVREEPMIYRNSAKQIAAGIEPREMQIAFNFHRYLWGHASLGAYHRELMIVLRRAADENHDGLLDGSDAFLDKFVAPLYLSMHGTRPRLAR